MEYLVDVTENSRAIGALLKPRGEGYTLSVC